MSAPSLLERRHETANGTSRALYSRCERYRYGLERQWGDGGTVAFVMLNPSTATELRNDPTIERCERRARAMGYGGLRILNLFGFRATRPADLRKEREPVGANNDAVLFAWCAASECVIAAWGVHGALAGRASGVADALPDHAMHLGLTKDGHPRHPLYVPYATGPVPWPRARRYAAAISR